MQLDLASGWNSHQLRIAGVALVGAGLIAVTPMAPGLTDFQHRAVALTSGAGDAWTSAMTEASDNLTSLGQRISDEPFPILSQLFDNQAGYAGMLGDNLGESLKGIEGIFTGYGAAQGLETVLPEAFEMLSKGDLFGAYGKLNTDFLFDMLNIVQPLFNHIPHGTDDFIEGVMGTPGEMLRNLANVSDVFADFSFWKSMASAVMAPWMGLNFEMTDVISALSTELSEGDMAGAANVLTNAPAELLGTLLNGYILPGETEHSHEFPGLITEGGTFDEFFVNIPHQIAEALGAGASDTAGDAGVDAVSQGAEALSTTTPDLVDGLLGGF